MDGSLIVTSSVAETIDRINDALFFGRKISMDSKKETAIWIAERQGGPHSYGGLFSPTNQDIESGFKLFTGEKVTSRVQIRHILGEESLRALALLNVKSAVVNSARAKAASAFARVLVDYTKHEQPEGWFCCGTCTSAFWRNLASGSLDEAVGGKERAQDMLAHGMKILKTNRFGNGKWHRFPFYFTLLVLAEIPKLAESELKYVAPVCEKLLARKASKQSGAYAIRRREVLTRLLNV